jgi:hypothetical protein
MELKAGEHEIAFDEKPADRDKRVVAHSHLDVHTEREADERTRDMMPAAKGAGGSGPRRRVPSKKRSTWVCPTCHLESCEHRPRRGRPAKADARRTKLHARVALSVKGLIDAIELKTGASLQDILHSTLQDEDFLACIRQARALDRLLDTTARDHDTANIEERITVELLKKVNEAIIEIPSPFAISDPKQRWRGPKAMLVTSAVTFHWDGLTEHDRRFVLAKTICIGRYGAPDDEIIDAIFQQREYGTSFPAHCDQILRELTQEAARAECDWGLDAASILDVLEELRGL